MTQYDNIVFIELHINARSINWETGNEKKIIWVDSELGMKGHRILLPPGNWQFIGISDQMGDKEWGQVVDHLTDYEMMRSGYKNYKKWAHEYDLFDNATASGQTLLQSLGITQRCAVLVKK